MNNLTQTLSLLSHKLNKYLINIIDQYNIVDLKILTTVNIKKCGPGLVLRLNLSFTIEDVIIKSIQRGYKGFFICKIYNFLIKEFDKKIATLGNKNISKKDKPKQNLIFYCFKNDKRDITYLDIMKM